MELDDHQHWSATAIHLQLPLFASSTDIMYLLVQTAKRPAMELCPLCYTLCSLRLAALQECTGNLFLLLAP